MSDEPSYSDLEDQTARMVFEVGLDRITQRWRQITKAPPAAPLPVAARSGPPPCTEPEDHAPPTTQTTESRAQQDQRHVRNILLHAHCPMDRNEIARVLGGRTGSEPDAVLTQVSQALGYLKRRHPPEIASQGKHRAMTFTLTEAGLKRAQQEDDALSGAT